MSNVGLLDAIPLWLLFPLACLLIIACFDVGFRLGRRSRRDAAAAHGPSVNVPVGAVLGFLAFMLAFTFNSAAHRFDERRDAVIDDSNAIEKTYLRTHLIAEPESSGIRRSLKEYVDIRLRMRAFDNSDVARTEELQSEMWAMATAASNKSATPQTAVLVEALNEMIDVNNKRFTIVFYHRIVHWIWFSLFVLMVLGVGSLGYQSGLHAKDRSPTSIALAMSFTIVLVATAALDRPGSAIFQVDQSPMRALQEHIEHDP